MRYHQAPSNLFAADEQLKKLEQLGDPLLTLSRHVDFEFFRPLLEGSLYADYDSSKGGRPPFDPVVMFKVMVLQSLYNLSDDSAEFMINDRASFRRFLDVKGVRDVPDAKTIWLFRERLREEGLVEQLFCFLHDKLEQNGIIKKEGAIVDASFVQAPRQRNTREENQVIKDGGIPEGWEETPSRLCQKDMDARWAKKNDELHYGYKDHIMVDRKSKMITNYVVTDAAVHDSTALEPLIESGQARDQTLYADAAYRGKEMEEKLKSHNIKSRVHAKGYANRPLTPAQKKSNKSKSSHRARIEHVFGFMTNSMNSLTVRCCSLERNTVVIGLMNLTYNLCRLTQLNRLLAPSRG
jgi:IS5 family transposase